MIQYKKNYIVQTFFREKKLVIYYQNKLYRDATNQLVETGEEGCRQNDTVPSNDTRVLSNHTVPRMNTSDEDVPTSSLHN